MNVKSKRNLFVFIIVAIAACSVLLFFIWKRLCFLNYIPDTYTESDAELSNPYIGWYTIHGYMLSDTETLTLPDSEAYTPSASGLVLLEVNLKNYADRNISEAALTQLDQLLTAWQNTGSQIILRFVYDWDGQNLLTEPKDFSLILHHMDQTAEIIRQYTTSVFLLQGIFVGNWGEMNNSSYMDPEDMTTLLTHLASVTDPSVFLAVRTPAQLRSALQTGTPTDKSQAFTGTLAARLGLFNDGMLGSETDVGTYGSSSADENDYTQAWSRKQELAFQNALCHYVPNGGEVILDNPYNDPETAITDLASMHVSYLNGAYDQAVLNKWKSAPYKGSDTAYLNCSTYDYISRHLGYRYVLTGSDFSRNHLLSKNGTLSLTLKNTGFASCYRPLTLSVNMVSETGEMTSFPIDTDLRFLQSKQKRELDIPIDLSTVKSGDYTFYLQITDPALQREIAIANTLEHTRYGYRLGSAQISKLPD